MSAEMTTSASSTDAFSDPYRRVKGLRGGKRVAQWLLKAGDVRNGSTVAQMVRRVPRLPRAPLPSFWFTATPNFGDTLAPVLLVGLSGLTPVHVPGKHQGKLLGLGSVLHHVAADDVVWGTGLNRNEPLDVPVGVQFLAVRGPLTRQLVRGDVPPVYGDPAVLMPMLYRPEPSPLKHRIALVPHYLDRELACEIARDTAITIIDVGWPWPKVIDAIAAAEVVLASSLHGLIIAEAYGIPAVWVRLSDRVVGAHLKFNDYFLGTEREERRPFEKCERILSAVNAAESPPLMNTAPLLDALARYVDALPPR